MNYNKKSLGQNFLRDKNVIKKIINSVEITGKDIIEIGPGDGSLTDQIIKHKPKSLLLIEKDISLFSKLNLKYKFEKSINIICNDFLKLNLKNIIKKNSIIFGNLPYNISSQILVKLCKLKNWPPNFTNLIFMFQKELGEKIKCTYPSKNYGRISILSHLRFVINHSFLVSPNCFFPKPKITSMVIHFKPKTKEIFKIKKINNLEKITNIFFSNKRKMINKNLKKIFSENEIKKFPDLDLSLRPSDVKPEIYYKITELYEKR